jgi:pectate lyase
MTVRQLREVLCAVVCALALVPNAFAVETPQVPAFPGAEGYGSVARGGRGGKVIAVTNLNTSGPGSLQAACNAEGPRIVVFAVAGTIDGNIKIADDRITIAGQTAPGDGICVKGNVSISANDVIIRYIRVRPNATGDAIGGRGIDTVILDHISCSWSNDEVLSIYQAKNLTIQHCLISEPCQRQDSHRFGGIWGAENGSFHNNCFAHCDNRTPRWAGKGNERNDFRNNVFYNLGYGGCNGASSGDKINMIANYYKPGPATKSPSRIAGPFGGDWYLHGNVVVGSSDVTTDNWKGISGKFSRINEPWPAMPIRQVSPEEAYEAFLEHGGCSLPNRDALDKRIIEEIRTGTANHGNNGIIDHPSDVGGWPTLAAGTATEDSDRDGMPDAWERRYGLDLKDASDNVKDKDKDGYTNIEEYINGTDPAVFVDYTLAENNVNTLK